MPNLVICARGLIVATAFCLMLVTSSAAQAEGTLPTSPGLYLSWVRSTEAAACVDASRIAADVVKRLGWSPFEARTGPQASIETLVTREALEWRAEIVMRRADGSLLGSREVESEAPTCDSLARASGLAIALMIETAYPDLGGAVPQSASTPPSKTPEFAPALPAANVAPQAADRVASSTNSRPGFSLTGGVLCATGILPGLACGPTLRTELEVYAPFSLAIAVVVLPERSIVSGNSSVAFGLSYASLGGCYRLGLGHVWSLSACAALLVGASHVAVEAQTPVTAGQRAWGAATAGVHSSLRHGALELQAGIGAVLPLDRHEYVALGAEAGERSSLFEEAGVGMAVSLAAGVHF